MRFLQIFVAVFLGRFTNIVLGERFPCQLIKIFIDICYNVEKKIFIRHWHSHFHRKICALNNRIEFNPFSDVLNTLTLLHTFQQSICYNVFPFSFFFVVLSIKMYKFIMKLIFCEHWFKQSFCQRAYCAYCAYMRLLRAILLLVRTQLKV